MSEQHVHDQLLEYLYAELDQEHAVEVERHLAGCESCRRRLGETRKLLGAYRTLPALQPPAGAAAVALAAARAGTRACPEPALPATATGAPPRSSGPVKVIALGRKLVFHPAWAMAACLVLLLGVLVAMPSLRELAEREVAPSPLRQRARSAPADRRRLAQEQARPGTQDELPLGASAPKSANARRKTRKTNLDATRSSLNELKAKHAPRTLGKPQGTTPGRDFSARFKGKSGAARGATAQGMDKDLAKLEKELDDTAAGDARPLDRAPAPGTGRKLVRHRGTGEFGAARERGKEAAPGRLGAGPPPQPARQEQRAKEAVTSQPRPAAPAPPGAVMPVTKGRREPAGAKQQRAPVFADRQREEGGPAADEPRQDEIVASKKLVPGKRRQRAALPPASRPVSPPAPEHPTAGAKPAGRLRAQDREALATAELADLRRAKNRTAAKAESKARKRAGTTNAGKNKDGAIVAGRAPRKPAASRPTPARHHEHRPAPPPAAGPVDRLLAAARAAMARQEYARALVLVDRCQGQLATARQEQPVARKKRVLLLRLQARCELAQGRLSQATSTIARLRKLDATVAGPLTRELAARRKAFGSRTPATTGNRQRQAARRTFSTDSYDEE